MQVDDDASAIFSKLVKRLLALEVFLFFFLN